MQPRNPAQQQLYWSRQSEVCVSPSLWQECPVIPQHPRTSSPTNMKEFSSLTSDPSFISSAIVSSSSVISSLQSSSSSLLPSTVLSSIEPSSIISSAALSPIYTFVFGSSVAPSCPCDIRASATQTEDSVSSSSSFHSVPTEEKDWKHFIEIISVEIDGLVKLKDVANERLSEKSEL